MPAADKRNAVLVCGLAATFYWVFAFAKHDPALRAVIPFGDDPYDAVAGFGVVVAALLAVVSLARAFRPRRTGAPSVAEHVLLLRSQMAVVLAVGLTLASDVVAMARHPSMWIAATHRSELVGLLTGLAVFASVVFFLVHASESALHSSELHRWVPGTLVFGLAMLVLAVYPERLIDGIVTHLLTVIVGAVVLLAPMRALLVALVPYEARELRMRHTGRTWLWSPSARWSAALMIGLLYGTAAFLGEMTEGPPGPTARLLLVASVFIGLGTAGLVLAYAFLADPLGL